MADPTCCGFFILASRSPVLPATDKPPVCLQNLLKPKTVWKIKILDAGNSLCHRQDSAEKLFIKKLLCNAPGQETRCANANYSCKTYSPTAARSFLVMSVFSHVKPRPFRPMWPSWAVSLYMGRKRFRCVIIPLG